VADSALVTKECLLGLTREKIDFISLMPGTFALERQLKDEAWTKDDWIDLGSLTEDPSAKKPARYRCFPTRGTVEGQVFDFLVVHSDHLDERKRKTLDRRIEALRGRGLPKRPKP
jgi:transposase